MSIVGIVVVGLALWVEFTYEPPIWLHMVMWFALTGVLSLALVRPLKGVSRRCNTITRPRKGGSRSDATPCPRWRSLASHPLPRSSPLRCWSTLGTWQLQRKTWKEGLIAQIEARAYGEPGAIVPPSAWRDWHPAQDEFRKVRVEGTFLHQFETPVYGLAPGQRGTPAQGFFLITPLRLADGAIVMVNRGFVPTELREPASRPESQPSGPVTVTGLVRAPEERNYLHPRRRPRPRRPGLHGIRRRSPEPTASNGSRRFMSRPTIHPIPAAGRRAGRLS